MNKNFFYATAILIGTIVGAGMFGIPYVVAQSGFLIGVIFLIGLTIISLLVHLMYGEIVCRTKEKHRLVGYAGYYLGKWGKAIITFSALFGLYGALLVYIIISGEFLSAIFSPILGGSAFVYSLIFFAIGALAIFKGLILIERLELIMTSLLVVIILIILFAGMPSLDISNLKTIDLKYFFLPYGVILWALSGGTAIPEVKEILKTNGKKYKKIIILGTVIPAILFFLFMFLVVGVAGTNTTPEAIEGLANFLGKEIIILGAIFGTLTIATSFFTTGLNLKKTLWYDYKINKHLSWLLTCSIPLIGFLLGLRQLIPIIGFLGVVLGALNGTALILIYKKAKKMGDQEPEYSLKIPSFVPYILIGIFALGLIYQVYYFVK